MTFKETGLNPELLKAIEELGFEQPTPVQEKAIPTIIGSDQDLIALAQTGTGKTAAFGLPLIHKTDFNTDKVQTLVLCPTRELCIQISEDLTRYSKYVKNFSVIPVYGGTSIDTQIRALKRGGQIVVGTPGRVLDLIERKVLKVTHIRQLVLDEADEMLNMGFQEDLDAILRDTPSGKQTLLFSATMPREIVGITKKYMNNPAEISVGKKNSGSSTISHQYYVVNSRDRYEVLKRIADINPEIYGIVFCRTRQETKDVADKLMQDGYNADALHGDLSQAQRDNVMNRFRIKHLQILVATDVAARGLDVNELTHVINYNLPDETEIYIHRSGRTGRAGRTGIAIAIITSRETRKISQLERLVGKQFELKKVPAGNEILNMQLLNLVSKVQGTEVDESRIGPFLPTIYEKLADLSREDIIKHFISYEFNRVFAYYKNSNDLNDHSKSSGRDRERDGEGRKNRSEVGYSRFHINIGGKDRLNASRLMGLINEQMNNRSMSIGKIDIMQKFTFFEVESQYEKDVLKAFKEGVVFEGESVVIELAKPMIPRGGDNEGRGERKRTSSSGGGFFDKKKKFSGGSNRGGERERKRYR